MAWEFNLWDDRDVALCCMLQDASDVLPGIESAMDAAIGLLAKAAHLRQFGIGLHRQTPALVLCQMPMQHVHFLQGQHVDDLLHKFWGHEMSTAIEEEPTVCQISMVLYMDGWKCEA